MYINSKFMDIMRNDNYQKSRAQRMRDAVRIWMSMHGIVSRRRVPFGPNSVLVLCGSRSVHPLSVEVVEQLFGRRRMQYILAGLEGRDCRADILKQRWWARCFGENARFPIIVTEHCPCWIEKKVITDAYSLLDRGGLFIRIGGGRKLKPSTPAYMRGRFEHVDHALDMHIHIFRKL